MLVRARAARSNSCRIFIGDELGSGGRVARLKVVGKGDEAWYAGESSKTAGRRSTSDVR